MKTLETTIALLNEKKSIVRPNAKTKREIKALEKEIAKLQNESADVAPIAKEENASTNNELLSKLNALNISEKTKKASASRSIFKSEFNNKSDRTKCRTKFINAISLMLIHLAQNKKELAKKEFDVASEIASKYYSAENKFNSYTDYCTENNEQKETIKLFIEYAKQNEFVIAE